MVSATVKDRIIIHLYNYHEHISRREMPYELSQPGIADTIGISRPHLSQEIRKIITDENPLIKEEVNRVKGLDRKRKVYFLTTRGVLKAQSLIEKFNEEMITLVTSQGKEGVLLKDIGKHIKGDNPMVIALSRVDSEGVLDLTEIEEFREDLFTDREEEMKTLKGVLKGIKKDGGSAIFLVGDPGIGKTRLMEEFEKHVLDQDLLFLSGRAYFESSDPYLPFKKVLEELNRKVDSATPITLSSLGRMVTRAEDKKMFDFQRETTFFEISRDVRAIAREYPMVVFLDDIQWADSATLQLIHYLSENMEDAPLFLIGAYRPRDVNMNPLLREVCQRMKREGTYREIVLKPLKWKHTKDIISNMLGMSRIPPEFVTVLYDLSEGNPLFVKECVKSLMEEGALDPKRNRYPKDAKSVRVPNIIISMIERRFSQLSDETLRMLHLGSVIGEEIPFELLLSVCGMDELDAFDHIDILLGTNIWIEMPDQDKFAFSHALVHLAAYDSISDMKKKRLHRNVAGKAEELYESNIEDHYTELAIRFEYAGIFHKAISYYYKAGKNAEELYAQEDALEMYGNSLRLWEREGGEPETGIKLLESLGDVNSLLGNMDASRAYYERILNENHEDSLKQRMYRKLARLWEGQGDFSKAKELVDTGLECYHGEDIETCRLYEIKGWILMQMGDFQGAEEVLEKERALAEKLGDEKTLSDSNHNLGTLMVFKANYVEAEKYLEKALNLREKLGDNGSIAKSLNNLGVVYKCIGDIDEALSTYERCLKIERKIGDKRGIAATLANMGTLQYMNNEPGEAEESFNRALESFKMVGDKMGEAMAYNNLGLVQMDMGDLDSALEYQEKGVELRKAMGDKQGLGMTLGIISSVLVLRGDLDRARTEMNRANAIFQEIGDIKGVALMKALDGDIHQESGEHTKALELYKESHDTLKEISEMFENIINCCRLAEVYGDMDEFKLARQSIVEGMMISREVGTRYGNEIFLRILGDILRKEGNLSGSLKVLTIAMERLEANKKHMELGRVYFEIGRSYLETGDAVSGKRYLFKARGKFRKMGMELWETRTEALLKEI